MRVHAHVCARCVEDIKDLVWTPWTDGSGGRSRYGQKPGRGMDRRRHSSNVGSLPEEGHLLRRLRRLGFGDRIGFRGCGFDRFGDRRRLVVLPPGLIGEAAAG